MANQINKQPQPSYRRDDDHGTYDDQLPTGGSAHGQEVSAGAQNSLDDINSLLNDIGSAESNPASPPKSGAGSGFYKPDSNPTTNIDPGNSSFAKRTGKFLKGKKGRNILIGSGIAGFGIGGAMSFLSVVSGPLQLVHLSQILQKPGESSSSDSSNRLSKLFRYTRAVKATDVGEARVGRLGSKIFGDTISKLSDVGIEFQRSAATGNPKSMTIDISKNPEFKGMSQAEAKTAIAKKFNIPESTVARINTGSDINGHKFGINTRDMGIKATRALSRNSLTYLENGKVVSSIRLRILADFFNVPSLFHPLKALQATVENKMGTAAERRATEEKRAADLEKANAAKDAAARENIKGKMSGWQKTGTAALLFTATMCIIRAIANDVVAVNNASIVIPSMLQASDKEAVGANIENGDVPSEKQVGAVVESLKDNKGKDVWRAKSLQVLAGGTNPSGEDISQDNKQAFSSDTTAANINNGFGGGTVGGIVCSPLGQATQALVGLALMVSGIFDGSGSWWIKAALAGAEVYASIQATNFIEQKATAILANKALTPEVFAGPIGGNLLAYGARAASNTEYISSGGIALSKQETAMQEQKLNLADQQEFQSKSYFARMFDTSDYRSATSRMADSISPSLTQNISTFIGKITGIGNLIPSLFSTLMPKVGAAETPYDWGFPKYGIPTSILDDPAMEDPYDNADKVTAILDTPSGQQYVEKAKTCFGATISKDSGAWDVTPSDPVNPTDEAYVGANCNDVSTDATWKRVILFVFDTRTMKAAACYQGDTSACEYSGFGGKGTAQTQTSTTPGTLPAGSAKDLATQLLPFIANGKISCNGQASNCPDIQKTAAGQSLNGVGSCNVDAMDPQVLGILLALVQNGHTFILSALCSDHASNPTSAHHTGKAADFNTIDGVFMGPLPDVPWTSAKTTAGSKLDQDIVSIAPSSVVSFGQAQCHPAFPFFQGYTVFNDDCHHQHIQVK